MQKAGCKTGADYRGLFINPSRFIFDLEATLKDAPAESVPAIAERFIDEKKPEILGFNSDDFTEAIRLALNKSEYAKSGITIKDANALF